jgi:hypothetical protein
MSRNQREGHYMGFRRLGPSKRWSSWHKMDKYGNYVFKQAGHQRKGHDIMVESLREGGTGRY